MHYYKRHIGDYTKKTAHLSPLEHGVYNLIIDAYYDRETAPTVTDAVRWARARTKEEKEAVLGVLDEFFTLTTEGRYEQQRIEDELAEYRKKADKNKAVGKLGGRPKKNPQETQETNPKITQTVSCGFQKDGFSEPTGNPNHKPLTNKEIPPIPPKGGSVRKKLETTMLQSYLDSCKTEGQKPIREDDSIFAYADKIGLPTEFLRLHWMEFKDRYTSQGAKKYKSWPTVFGKSVKGNWFKLWFLGSDGVFQLTTVGQQAQRNHGGGL